MNTIFSTVMTLAKELNQSTISKLQKNVDAFLDGLGTNSKPLNDPEFFLPHSKSKTYPNGNYVNEFADSVLLSDEDRQTAKDLFVLHHAYITESALILKYLKATTMRTILLFPELSNAQFHQLVLDILPEFILNDTNLLKKCSLDDDEIKDLQKHKYAYNNAFPTDERKAQFFAEMRDEGVFELMQKYYALDLLTNF